MKTTITINGLPVEFTDEPPTKDGVYWILDGVCNHVCLVENGYTDGTGVMPSETNWLWSAPLVPSDKLEAANVALETSLFECDQIETRFRAKLNKCESDVFARDAAMQRAKAALLSITSGHFYQSSCRGGEMEQLMNQAIEILRGNE